MQCKLYIMYIQDRCLSIHMSDSLTGHNSHASACRSPEADVRGLWRFSLPGPIVQQSFGSQPDFSNSFSPFWLCGMCFSLTKVNPLKLLCCVPAFSDLESGDNQGYMSSAWLLLSRFRSCFCWIKVAVFSTDNVCKHNVKTVGLCQRGRSW